MRGANGEYGDAIDREPPEHCFHERRVWVTTVTVLGSKQEVYRCQDCGSEFTLPVVSGEEK